VLINPRNMKITEVFTEYGGGTDSDACDLALKNKQSSRLPIRLNAAQRESGVVVPQAPHHCRSVRDPFKRETPKTVDLELWAEIKI
jgi:hypothetical protein